MSEMGNGRPPTPAQRALRRHADETAAWIDAVTDPDALSDVVDAELALITRATRRLRVLRVAAARPEEPDDWIGIEEVARLIHRSISWIRHQPPETIPGRRQHVAGGRVEWSRRIVQAWLDAHTARA